MKGESYESSKVIVSRTFPLEETQTALFYNPPDAVKVVITIP
jgi:hypothetical protein